MFFFARFNPPKGYFAHWVLEKEWDDELLAHYFTIGNAKGHRNGWCWIERMYGKLVDVWRGSSCTSVLDLIRLQQPTNRCWYEPALQ